MLKLIGGACVALALAVSPLQAAETLNLEQYKGKLVYLDFWASWCGPCVKSFPWMEKMQQRYADQGFQIVAVTVDEDPTDADKFLQDHPVSFDIVRDPKGEFAQKYSLMGMPTSFLIGRDGKEISHHIGFKEADEAEYEANIKRLLAQGK